MTKSGAIVLVGTVLSFLLIPIPPSNGNLVAGLSDKAGLPYPEDNEGTVFLRQAFVSFDVHSRWSSIEGSPPWHFVLIRQTAIYVLDNPGSPKTINITFPMLPSLYQSGTGLVFQVGGIAMNYSALRWVQVLDDDGLCCLEMLALFTLSVFLPSGEKTTITVQLPQSGATGRVATYTFFMANASRWSSPIESFTFSFHLAGGALTSSTIPSSANTTSVAFWSMANQTPTQDLVISWAITEPEPPFQYPRPYSSPHLLTIASLVLGTAVASVAILYFMKRRSRIPEVIGLQSWESSREFL